MSKIPVYRLPEPEPGADQRRDDALRSMLRSKPKLHRDMKLGNQATEPEQKPRGKRAGKSKNQDDDRK